MSIVLVNDTEFKISEKKLAAQIKKIIKQLETEELPKPELLQRELTLVFLNKLEAKRLNWQYRQKDYATDVLSFEAVSEDSFGELIFCPEVLEKQAAEGKHSFEKELGLMLIHGILHLLGFDHEAGGDEEKKMMSLQDKIFQNLYGKEPASARKTKK